MYTSRLKFLWFTHTLGAGTWTRTFGPAPMPVPRQNRFPFRSFLPKPYDVRWKSLTVICKQCKRAANVFLRIHTTRDERIKLKRKNNQPSTNSLRRRPGGIPQDTRPSSCDEKTTSYGNYYSKKNKPTEEEKEQNAHKNSSKKQTFLLWEKKTGRKIIKKHPNPFQQARVLETQQSKKTRNASATHSVKNCNEEYFLIYGVHKNTHSRFFMYYNNNKVWKKNQQLNKMEQH